MLDKIKKFSYAFSATKQMVNDETKGTTIT